MVQEDKRAGFVICIRNTGSEDLEVGKVYKVLADESAARDDYIRVIDESGQDYLYPMAYFVPVSLSEEAEKKLAEAILVKAA